MADPLNRPCDLSVSAGSSKADTRSAPILLAAALLAGGTLCSCSTTGSLSGHAVTNPASAAAAQASIAKRWVKVRDNPPTWYPRGVPSDIPTGFSDGEWVCTRDARDTRFFIPLRGMPQGRRDALLQEAMAMRDAPACGAYEQQRRRQEAREDARKFATQAAGAMVKLPFLAAVGVSYIFGASSWTQPPSFGAAPSINVSPCVGGNSGAGCGGNSGAGCGGR